MEQSISDSGTTIMTRSLTRRFMGKSLGSTLNCLMWLTSILTAPDDDSIIVIMSDHGYLPGDEPRYTHHILAAYRLPHGGAKVIYPGITSVNVFRMILDHYFDLGLGRVEDQVHWSENRG